MVKAASRYLKICAVAVLCVFIAGCATYRAHPEFKERHKSIAKIAVMAPQVDAYLLTFKGDKNRLDYVCSIMEKAMVDGMEYTFSQKGYEIKKLDLGTSALARNPELKTAVFNINKLFDKALDDIRKGKQGKFTYSVGPDINLFADLSDSDAIIFMRGVGMEKSEGEIAKEVVKSVAVSVASAMVGAAYTPSIQTSAVTMDVAVVDANDGAILWYNNNAVGSNNYSPRNNRQVSTLTRYLVLAFPDRVAGQPPQQRASSSASNMKDLSVAPVMTPPVSR
jgi:hypothetical protein